MFNNREIRIKMVKTPDTQPSPTMATVLNPDSVQLIEDAGRRFVKQVAVCVVATVGAIVVIDHLGEIAEKLTPAR